MCICSCVYMYRHVAICYFTDHKQIVFKDIKDCLTERTKDFRKSYFSHSRVVYSWILYLPLIFALSLVVLQTTSSSVFQALMLVALSILLGRSIVGSLVAFGQLSAKQNMLEDIQYYMR